MTTDQIIALGQAWGGPLTAFVTGGWGFALAYLRYRKWVRQNRGMLKSPPSSPSVLPLLMVLGGGAAGFALTGTTQEPFAAKVAPAACVDCPQSCTCKGKTCKCPASDERKRPQPPPPKKPATASFQSKPTSAVDAPSWLPAEISAFEDRLGD